MDDRALPEQHADQARGRDARGRALRRRGAVGQRPPAGDRDGDARLHDGDLRLADDARRRLAELRVEQIHEYRPEDNPEKPPMKATMEQAE